MLNFNHAIMGSRHIVSPFWAMGQSTPAYPVGGGGEGGGVGVPTNANLTMEQVL